MPMEIDEWRESVGSHLDKVWAGANMALTHVEALPIRPVFATLAEDELDRCEKVLSEALQTVRLAKAIYGNKPVEGEP